MFFYKIMFKDFTTSTRKIGKVYELVNVKLWTVLT